MNEKQPFNGRGLTSFIVLFSFLVMLLSGIMLYVSPRGRVANWTGWTMWGLEKHEWESLHLTMAITFLVVVAFHIYFNWSYLVRYVKDAAARGFHSKRELSLASLVVLAIFVGTHADIPPFSSASEFGEKIKDYWEANSSHAPYAHAEESTVVEFAQNIGLPEEEVVERLRAFGVDFGDTTITLGDLATGYGCTPEDLYAVVLPNRNSSPVAGGLGIGRMTLREACDALGLDSTIAISALAKNGIEAAYDDILRDLAEEDGRALHEIVSLITGDQEWQNSEADSANSTCVMGTPIDSASDAIPHEAFGRRGQGRGYGRGYGRGFRRASEEGR